MFNIPNIPDTVDGRNPLSTCDLWKPMKHGLFSISTGAGFLPSTVSPKYQISFVSIHCSQLKIHPVGVPHGFPKTELEPPCCQPYAKCNHRPTSVTFVNSTVKRPRSWRRRYQKIRTPLKVNMEPEKKSLEKEIPFGNHHFQVPC